jgi:integrase/recombinase XerD
VTTTRDRFSVAGSRSPIGDPLACVRSSLSASDRPDLEVPIGVRRRSASDRRPENGPLQNVAGETDERSEASVEVERTEPCAEPTRVERAEAAVERIVARARLHDERARFIARTASPATARTYTADLRHFFRWLGVAEEDGTPALEDVRRVTWREVAAYRDRFYQPCPETGRCELSPATGARRLAVLSGFFSALARAGVVPRDPTDGVARPRAPDHGRTRGLTPDEVNRVLAACPRGTFRADRDRLFLGVLFFEWLRIAEACRLRADDLGEEQGVAVLHVRQKGGRERRLALHEDLARCAREYVERWDVRGFLFPSLARGSGDRPITPDGARALVWRPAILRAGLDPAHVSPHSARVAGITAALLLDVPLPDVQDFAGHARPETTLRYHRARARLDRAPVRVLPFRL